MAGWVDRWREVTVAIGRIEQMEVQRADGKLSKAKFFAVVGTGVLFGLEGDRTRTPWLVTAKHVFSDPSEGWEPSALCLLFSWSANRRNDRMFTIPVRLTHGGRRRWVPHSDQAVDLACLPLSLKKEQSGKRELPRITFSDVATTEDIYEGAPVFVLGYPGAVGSSFWPRALVRQGIVSWVSTTEPESQVFLIDSHVYPGNSGGPVFTLPAGTDRQGHFATGGKVALLGIVTQARIQNLPLMAGGKEVEVEFKDQKAPATLLAPSFLGIGLVEPACRVRQLLATAIKSRTRRR